MRISTEKGFASARPVVSASPSRLTRACYFVAGALLGAIVGYGLITAGPGPAPSLLEPYAAAWVFGGAIVCGALAAANPKAFGRQNRFRWRHGPDD